jgi:hypothetical protein
MKQILKDCTLNELLSQREDLTRMYIGEVNKPDYYFERLGEIDKHIAKQAPSTNIEQREGFTGGEWYKKWDSDTLHTGIDIYSDNGEKIVEFVMGANLQEAEANAALLAQAKNMYYELKDCVAILNYIGNYDTVVYRVMAILEKAKPTK